MRRILPIFTIVFIGFLGFALPFPIFPPMLLIPELGFLPEDVSGHSRVILLGIMFSFYPLGQLFGGPFFGQLSDRYGRKKILIISLVFTFFAYLGTALSVTYKNIPFLMLSRFVCGICEGNIVIATSAMADISTPKTKGKNFGYLTFASSFGFIIGPLLGGELANPKWGLNYSTPFWGVSIFVLLTLLVVIFWFKETGIVEEKARLNLFETFSRLYKGLTIPNLRAIYIINFFIYFGIFCYFNFTPLFLVDAFSFGTSKLALFTAYEAIPICIAALFLVGPVSKILTPRMASAFSGLFFGIVLFIMVLPHNPYALWITLFFLGIFIGISFTNMAVMVSNRTDERNQGMALGINQSVQVLSEALSALFGGFLGVVMASFPLLVGGAVTIIASLILTLKRFKEKILMD